MPAESVINISFLLLFSGTLFLVLKEAVRNSSFIYPIDAIVKMFVTAYTSFFCLFSKAAMTVITAVMAVTTAVIELQQ
jgi:hypothetical protein